MNFTQIFKKLKSNIHEIEREELNCLIDKYDWSGKGNYTTVKDKTFTYKNIKITINYVKRHCNGKVEVVRETKLFYNNKEIELNKTTAHRLIKLLKES